MSEANTPNDPPSPEEGGRRRLPRSVAPSPDNPPLLEEADLNDAEKKVLKAFREGWEKGARRVNVFPAGVVKESTDGLIAKELTAEDTQDAILRASFLRGLFLGSYDKFAPRLVTISCALIEGKLDLDYCESLFPLSFFCCIFPEGISLQSATVPDLALTKCLIGQAGWPFGLSAPKVKVATDVKLANQFKTFGKVNLIDADIGGELCCVDGTFEKGLNARSSKTGKDVILSSGFKADDAVFLVGADIGRNLDCSGGHFKYLYAWNLKAGGSVSLCGEFDYSNNGSNIDLCRKFESTGEVNLSRANIGGQLYCAHGNFKMGLNAVNLEIGEDVFLGSGYSVYSKDNVDGIFDGNVDLSNAYIVGKLSCVSGHFKKGLKAHKLKTGGDVLLRTEIEYDILSEDNGNLGPRSKFKSIGEVDLSRADIGGKLSCEGGHFEEGLKAKNLKTGGDMLLNEGFKPNGKVDLNGASIGGRLDCTGTHFPKGLVADGLRYQWIELGGDWKRGLAWLSKSGEESSSLQPYEQLMTVYRHMGRTDWAREIGFELEEKKHKDSKGLWGAWHSILKWTNGYGYKPFRALWWILGLAIGLPLVGALLFSDCIQNVSSQFTSCGCVPTYLDNEWIPSEGEALSYWGEKGRVPQGYPEFNPIIYSFEATFPLMSLGQLDKWHSDSPFLRLVRWILTFIGNVLLAIFALFGLGVLGPNWKSEGDGG